MLEQDIDSLNEKETLYYINMLDLFFEDWKKVDDDSQASIYSIQIDQFEAKRGKLETKLKKGDYDKYKSKDKIEKAIKGARQTYSDSKKELDARAKQENEALNGDAEASLRDIALPERKLGYSNESISSKDTNVDETISEANDFINKADTDKINETNLSKTVKNLYNILFAIAIVVAVIVGTYMAIKLITSSVEGKAQIKKMFTPYVIGCIVAFGAFGIWALVMKIFNAM